MHDVANVEQEAVPGARARGHADRRVDRDVVALIGDVRALRALAVRAALPQTGDVPRRVGEDARVAHDLRVLRMVERHLNHVDSEQRRVLVLFGRKRRAARELVRRAHTRRAGDVDVDVLRVLRVDDQRVGVRSAARLHRGDLFRMIDVRDVEDAHAAESLLAHRVQHAPAAAVDAAARLLDGEEEQVSIECRVALSARADERAAQPRVVRVRDVPDLKSVESALDDDVPLEGEVAVQEAEVAGVRRIVEALRLLAAAEQLHAARGLLGIPPAGAQADARIRLTQRREGAQREDKGGSSRRADQFVRESRSHVIDLV